MRDWTDSQPVNQLDALAERFFCRLMMKADDYGRFHADPRLLKSALFPLLTKTRNTDIPHWIAACEKAGLVRCYVAVNGRKYIEVLKFDQRRKWMKAEHPPPEGQIPLFEKDDGLKGSRSRSRREEPTKTIKTLSSLSEGDCQGGNKKLPQGLSEIALRFEKALNSQWINDAGKWVNRIKAESGKCERVIAEVENAAIERRIQTSPAQYAEQIWKEFK